MCSTRTRCPSNRSPRRSASTCPIYNKTFYDDYLYNGSHWAVPYARSTPLFYYNKAHFAKAGLPDRAPKTWDEMDEFGKKLMAANLGTQAAYNWALPTNYVAWYYQNKAWGWGGEYSNQWDLSPIVGQGMIDSLTWAAKTMKTRGGWAGMTSNSQSNDLAAEVVSACLDSTGTLGVDRQERQGGLPARRRPAARRPQGDRSRLPDRRCGD
jgi:sn-glycerol 3-phosphate transport system substrate-binding protein